MQVTTAVAAGTTTIDAKIKNEHKEPSQLQLNINATETGDDGVDKTPQSPFQREIREWQHIDPDTGALLTKRLEADRWINGPLNKYGKISNSQNIAQPNGTQHTQSKQLEVLQSCTNDGGAFQLIRTQSSSRWSSSTSSANTSPTMTTTETATATTNTTTTTTTDESAVPAHVVVVVDDHDDHSCSVGNGHGDHGEGVSVEKLDNNIGNLFHKHPNNTNNRYINTATTTTPTKINDDHRKTTKTKEDQSWSKNQSQASRTRADSDAVSSNGLEICEVSDTEIADIDYIDCNGIVIDADDDHTNDHDDDDDDDHDHEVYYHGQRVFDIKVHIEADYERPRLNEHNNNHNDNLKHKHNNNNNQTHNNSNNKNHTFPTLDKNNLLHTTPSIKLSNLMKSNSSTSTGSNNSSLATTKKPTTTTRTRMSEKPKVSPTTTTTKNATKISLSAVVGENNKKNDEITEKKSSTAKKLFGKQPQQQHEQQVNNKPESILRSGNNIFIKSTLYGNNNNKNNNNNNDNINSKLISNKSRVGAKVALTNERGSDVGVEEDNDEFRHNEQQNNSHVTTRQLTPTRQELIQLNPQQQKQSIEDLESFRLYNQGIALSINGKQQQQQQPQQHDHEQLRSLTSDSHNRPLQRTQSISTDDLSNDTNDEEKLSDWRRVTKLRRSFQSNSTSTASSDSVNTPYPNQQITNRPTDLPTNSVSVARIRAELEQGRRLQTTMRNNKLDLAALDNILNNKEKETPTIKTSTMVTAETLQDIRAKLKKLSDETLYKSDYLSSNEPATLIKLTDMNDTCNRPNSLAGRQKIRSNIDSIDWQNRRKSYGFEKMLPTEEKSNIRMDASTDSGLGRSGDIGNWSPTGEPPRSTVVHLGQSSKVNIVPNTMTTDDLIKRHSIAVDACKYVGDNSIRKPAPIQLQAKSIIAAVDSNRVGGGGSAGKRVEFCKTEVHFAAESGRVNIVETDGKPPPTNNFRRRRRVTGSSGPLQTLVKNATPAINNLPIKRFGDDQTTAYTTRALLTDTPAPKEPERHVEEKIYNSSSFITTANGNDTTDNETDDSSALRGILKNRPIKPRPYHLGENISSADALWGVHLRPVANVDDGNNETNLNNLTSSVAERIRQVESGFSTKVNLNMDETEKDWPQPDISHSNVMSIELRSPQITIHNPEPIKLRPLAKPRTFHQPTTVQLINDKSKQDDIKESLKIVREARGARKLREHELSYFGVQVLNNSVDNERKTKTTHNNNLRRTLPNQRKINIENDAKNITKTQLILSDEQDYKLSKNSWQLLNDKPDLLQHNPIVYPAERKSLNTKKLTNTNDHTYENITTDLTPIFKVNQPEHGDILSSYDRKMDIKRDARILSEMSYNADQTLKAVTKESALKDQRRRSIRRPSTPLETIDEKSKAQKVSNTCIAVKVNRKHASPTNIRHTASSRSRSSSFSSVDNCPRARSRSLSSEFDSTKSEKSSKLKINSPRHIVAKSYHEDDRHQNSLELNKRNTTYDDEEIKIVCPNCNNGLTAKEKINCKDKEKISSSHKTVTSTTHSSSKERARCATDQHKHRQQSTRTHDHTQRATNRHSADVGHFSASGSGRFKRREENSSAQNSFRKLTNAFGLIKPSAEKTTPKSKSVDVQQMEKSHANKSRGHSNRSSANSSHERHQKSTTNESGKSTTTRNSSKIKKQGSDSAESSPMTYVYETNLASTQNKSVYLENYLAENNANYEHKIDINTAKAIALQFTSDEDKPRIPPQKPPRKKHKLALLAMDEDIPSKLLPRFSLSDPLPPLPFDEQFNSYSQQSTLCKNSPSLQFHNARRPSYKYTHSTSSSFAFLPGYLPPKRNSNVSHVYDNCLLYDSTPFVSEQNAYQHHDHSQFFGSTKRHIRHVGTKWKAPSIRVIRRRVTTRRPFSLCTCS